METYRVRYAPDDIPPTLLLPVSFGVSSISLLNLIDGQLKGQVERTGRTGFKCLIVHVDESCVDPSVPPREHLDVIQQQFPDVGRYMTIGLEDIYDFRNAAREVELENGVDEEKMQNGSFDKKEALKRLLSALSSPTSRMDVLSIIRTRLIVEVAKKEGCEAVLWGDTTTRLAQKTLAETAKGRGFSIPWQISDGDSPFGIRSYPRIPETF